MIDRGWHTDIAIPAADITGGLIQVSAAFPGATYFIFGFGDRGYVVSRRKSPAGTIRAMFPDAGAMLVTALRDPPAAAFGREHVIPLRVTPIQTSAVVNFIDRAFAHDAHGLLQPLGEGPYAGSAFYGSDEVYDLFHDCNYWTLAALRSGGLPVRPDGVVFASQAVVQVEEMGR